MVPTDPRIAEATRPVDLQVLASWAPELAETFVALSSDIALVLDAEGLIVRISQHDERPIAPPHWLGQRWIDTVASDSRSKIDTLLAEVAQTGHATRREINHPAALGGSVPVAYSVARLGADGPMLAVGHDLRAQAALQQRFVAAQEALERSYWNTQAKAPSTANARPAAEAAAADGSTVIDDNALVDALRRLVDRIGQEQLPGLLRDARRLAEQHFLARALERAGGTDALKRPTGLARRPSARRKKV